PRLRGLEARGEGRLLPLFQRRTQAGGDLWPALSRPGLAPGDCALARRWLRGAGAPRARRSLQRLQGPWEAEYEPWRTRDLSDRALVDLGADGLSVQASLEQDPAALRGVLGALRDGTPEVLAVARGLRASTESWQAVLRARNARGLPSPRLPSADGPLGSWGAWAPA
ncbi:MAG: IS256 family transposase, partial [Armatimonadota bacterium]|nr:IS256 family transposase [Armatimonadota bacterium]